MHAFEIRPANVSDAAIFPAIERSAGLRFRTLPDLAWVAEGDDLSRDRYREIILKGASWTCLARGERPVGFLCAEILNHALHIWEFAVCFNWQRSGMGRALLAHAIGDARRRELDAVTLTTFRDVAWNAPFYQTFGFYMLDDDAVGERLQTQLVNEAKLGLPIDRRVAMRLAL